MSELNQIKKELESAVNHFNIWVKQNHSEFEIKNGSVDDCGYPNWQVLEELCERIFKSSIFNELAEIDKGRIVFIIGRQWDLGTILNWFSKGNEEIGQLGMTKTQLLDLAKVALKGNDTDAKGQFAASLSKVGSSSEVTELLLKYHKDSDEYVRRQALYSLEKMGYSQLDALVIQSWNYNEEFERMMCLNLMANMEHEKYEVCLIEALNDDREYLKGRAEELKKVDNTM